MALPFTTYDDHILYLQDGVDYIVPQSTIIDQQTQQPALLNLYEFEFSETLIVELQPGDRIQKFTTDNDQTVFVITTTDKAMNRTVEFLSRESSVNNVELEYFLYVGFGVQFGA